MQTMILQDPKRRSFLNTSLRTIPFTFSTANAGIRDVKSLFLYFNISQKIRLPENRIYSKIKVFHLRTVNTEDDSNASYISRIHIR